MVTAFRDATTPKLTLAAVVACLVFAVSHAFAASLGASAEGLAAGDELAASCGSGMKFDYTTAFYSRISAYAIDGVDLSNIPAGCLGKNVSVTFYGSDDVVSGSEVAATLPASGTTRTIPVSPSSNTIAAGQVGGISVVVS